MTFVRYIKVNRMAPLFMIAWQAGFLVFGVAVVLVINTFFNEEPDYACMGSLFALIGMLAGVFARGNTNGHTRFRLAVSMGNTRRSYLLCDPIISLLTGAIGVAVAWCMYQAESRLYTVLYPGFENEIPLGAAYQLKYILPALVILAVVDLFFSAILQRFGMKSFGVVWFAWCAAFLIIPRAIDAYQEGSTSLFARIGGVLMAVVGALSVTGWLCVGAAVLLALLAFAVWVFHRAEARL